MVFLIISSDIVSGDSMDTTYTVLNDVKYGKMECKEIENVDVKWYR